MPAPATRSYVLRETADADALVDLLRERFMLVEARSSRADRTTYDTADRRLRAAGLELGHERAPGGGSRLTLHVGGDSSSPPLTASVTRRKRYLLEDLSAGPLRDRIAPVIEMRALLPTAAMRSRIRRFDVLNADEKTVVRLALEQAAVAPTASGRPATPLAPRLNTGAVLGYDKQLARVERVLRCELRLEPATRSLVDEAVLAQGGDPRGLSSKPEIDLEPGMRADEAAIALLRALSGVTEANLPGTLDDVDTEFLHRFRVSLRRARSVLRELEGVFPPQEFARHRAALRRIQIATGPLRDLDVQLLEWDGLTERIAAPARADLEPLHALLVRRRGRELRALRRELRGKRFRDEWAAWRAFLEGSLGPEHGRPDAALPVERVAARRIHQVHRRMIRDGRAIDDSAPPEALHDLRKRGKELRYLLELFGGLFAAEVVKPLVSSLKGLQEVLGRHQDRHVQADTLRALARELHKASTAGSDALLALGVVVERLDTEQAEARAEFGERFAAFASKQQRKLVADTFGAGR